MESDYVQNVVRHFTSCQVWRQKIDFSAAEVITFPTWLLRVLLYSFSEVELAVGAT